MILLLVLALLTRQFILGVDLKQFVDFLPFFLMAVVLLQLVDEVYQELRSVFLHCDIELPSHLEGVLESLREIKSVTPFALGVVHFNVETLKLSQ